VEILRFLGNIFNYSKYEKPDLIENPVLEVLLFYLEPDEPVHQISPLIAVHLENGKILESSVSDPGCLSRIPDPDFYPSRIPDPKTATKE
jgi:hypothetical protein